MIAVLGTVTIAVFVFLIFTKRLHVITALISVPIVAGVIGGFGPKLGAMMFDGLKTTAPTGIMIMFSVLFFCIQMDTGLFNPLIQKIVSLVKNDPLKISIGTAVMTLAIALDGEGVTNFVILTLTMLPIYRRLGMNPLVFTCLASLANYLMNSSPWGGPTMRAMAVLHLGVDDLFTPLLPAMGVGLIWLVVVAYILGMKERKRLGYTKEKDNAVTNVVIAADIEAALNQDATTLRPKLMWINLALVIVVMVALVMNAMPPAILFIIAFCATILINYRDFDQMETRIRTHAGNALWATVVVFAAGVFTGIFRGTKMIDEMALGLVALIPDALGHHMAIMSGVLSYFSTLIVSPDAFYFGVLPIISQAASHFGIDPVQSGRAVILGQLGYGISPLVAAPLLLCSLTNVQFSDHQRFAFIWGLSTAALMLLTAVLTGVIPF